MTIYEPVQITGQEVFADKTLKYKANNLNNKAQKKGVPSADIGNITTKFKRVRKLFPNYQITNKIIRPVESLKSKAKRRKKNNENNENKDEG